MKCIELWKTRFKLMLLIEHSSGVHYQSKIEGEDGHILGAEGLLQPLRSDGKPFESLKAYRFVNDGPGIDTETADFIDSLLKSRQSTSSLSVDRARLEQSRKSWVYVTIASPETTVIELYEGYLGNNYGFGHTRGVLLWPSDDSHGERDP